MSCIVTHPHAAFDRFPALVESLRREFGTEGLMALVERVVAAEAADLHWDGRIAERNLGAYGSADDDGDAGFERVAILGVFRGYGYTAVCVVDSQRRVRRMARLCRFERIEDAERAFLDGGG